MKEMKKMLLGLIFTTSIIACSSDESKEPEIKVRAPKITAMITESLLYKQDNDTVNFYYNDSEKLIRIERKYSYSTEVEDYFYSDLKVNKIRYTYIPKSHGAVVNHEKVYLYNDTLVSNINYISGNLLMDTTTISRDEKGQINFYYNFYKGSPNGYYSFRHNTEGNIKFAANNSESEGIELEYDTRKNPLYIGLPIDITKLLKTAILSASKNNITKYKADGSNDTVLYEYQYNEANYPVSAVKKVENGEIISRIKFIYK